MFQKLESFTNKVANLADKPTLSPTELKAHFDAAPDEVRQYLNNLIDGLKSTAASDSGAKNIGISTIPGANGSDIQTVLETLTLTKAKKEQSGWIPLVLQNALTRNGVSEYPPGYRKNEFNEVEVLASVVSSVDVPSGTVIANLPVGARPAYHIAYPAICATASGTTWGLGVVYVKADGDIKLDVVMPGTRYVFINLPHFPADQ